MVFLTGPTSMLKRTILALKRAAERFPYATRGNIAVTFGLVLFPALVLGSIGINYSQSVGEKSKLQALVDSAALAGVQVYANTSDSSQAVKAVNTYMNSARASLNATGLTFTTSPSTSKVNGLTSSYIVAVSANATVSGVAASLTKSLGDTKIGANATARLGTSYTATFKLNNFFAAACDANTIYWYIVPKDGSAPVAANLTKVWANTDLINAQTASIPIQFGDSIGFALKNVTGAVCPYGSNGYGSPIGRSNWFYSHLTMPSKVAYPTVMQNCSLMTILDPTNAQLPPAQPGKAGTCAATVPNYAALDCSQQVNHTVLYLWNDMGGPVDDKDYNDADYTVSCAVASGGVTAGTGPVLNR